MITILPVEVIAVSCAEIIVVIANINISSPYRFKFNKQSCKQQIFVI